MQLGGGEHRRDADVLRAAVVAPQAPEIDESFKRLNEKLKRRTLVVRIFPNAASCLRLSRALAVEMHENWIEAMRYLNMDLLREQRKARGQASAAA